MSVTPDGAVEATEGWALSLRTSMQELANSIAPGLGHAFRESYVGLAILDTNGRYAFVNPALCEILGRTDVELIGTSPADITHPEDRNITVATLNALYSGQRTTDRARKRYVRPDRSVVVAVRTTTVLRDTSGRITGLLSQVIDMTEASEAQERLRRSEKRFRALVAQSSELTVLVDSRGRIFYTSPACSRLLGLIPEEMEGRSALEFLHPDELERAEAMLTNHLAGIMPSSSGEYRIIHKDGTWRDTVIVTSNLLHDPDVEALVINVRDVTEERQYQREVAASERRLRALVGSAWDVISLHDQSGRCLYCSPAVTRMLGYTPEELVGTAPGGIDSGELSWPVDVVREAISSGKGTASIEYRHRHKNGDWRWIESTFNSTFADPAVGGVVVSSRDVTARRRRTQQQEALATLTRQALAGGSVVKLFDRTAVTVAEVLGIQNCQLTRVVGGRRQMVARHGRHERDLSGFRSGVTALIADGTVRFGAITVYGTVGEPFTPSDVAFLEATANVLAAALGRRGMEERLRRQALHDQLTALPNRTALIDRLSSALRRIARTHESVALLFVDADDLKLVNDTMGHAAGDQVVSHVAAQITGCLRSSDIVARFGGDEFVVLCESTDAPTAERIAQRVRDALASPVAIGDRTVVVTASIGIASTSDPSVTADELLSRADTAMYAAKRDGKDRSCRFNFKMQNAANEQLEVSWGLRRALAEGEFQLHYQPVVEIPSRSVIGAEALLRWQHPSDGLLTPVRFIAYAEASGLIVPIGAWVIEEACRQSTVWNRGGLRRHVSINVSGRQLVEADIVATVEDALEKTGANPDDVHLEVTESALMSDLDRAARAMSRLRSLGVHVGMDDFGTGYSSLSYLANLPFDFVKADKSFVAEVGRDSRMTALLRTIAQLGRSLDLTVVAEGVETEEQLEHVRNLSIPQGQGFLFGRPALPGPDGAL